MNASAAFGGCWFRLTVVFLALLSARPAEARATERGPAREVLNLFQQEMQQAVVKLKWHGERLTDDTVYAVALSGLSWLPAWEKQKRLTLAADEKKKFPKRKQNPQPEKVIEQVQRSFAGRDYGQITRLAAAFTPEEISRDVRLKNAVGESLLASGKADEAFAVFAGPFEPPKSVEEARELDLRFRERAFQAAVQAVPGDDEGYYKRAAVSLAVSLLLDPNATVSGLPVRPQSYLERAGVDIERLAEGILEAPERLPILPNYTYVAADILLLRPTPRLLPYLMHLAQSDDVYLRSRAVLGLGILSYAPRLGEPSDWSQNVVTSPLRAYGLSSREQAMIAQEVKEAANSDKYRLRCAAATALALMGNDKSLPLLQKLALDKAYLLAPLEKNNKRARIVYPVRVAAGLGLARFGLRTETLSGEFAGKDLDKAKRGGQDVTNDQRNLRKENVRGVPVCALDTTLLPFANLPRR